MAEESSMGSDALYDLKRSKKITGHLDDEWEESQSSRKDSYKKTSRFSSLGHSGITDPRKRRNENVITKPSECNKPLEEGENRDPPLVSCNDKIMCQRRRKNKNVIEIYEGETDSDIDPDYVNFLSNLKEHGNANALEYESDGSPRLIVYEGECSSDDERKDMEKAQLGEKDHKASIKTKVEINERFNVISGSKNNQLRGKLTERSYEVRQGKRVGAQNRKKNVRFVEGDEDASERVTMRVGAQNRNKNVRFVEVEGEEEASERVTIPGNNAYFYHKNSRKINRCGKLTRAVKGKNVVHGNDKSNRNFVQIGNKDFEENETMSGYFGRVQLEKREAINSRKEFKKVVEEENMVNRAHKRSAVLFNSDRFYEKSGHVKRNHFELVNEEAGPSRSKWKRVVKEECVIQKVCKGNHSKPLEKDGKKNNEETDSDSETSTDVEILERAAFHKMFKRNRRNTN